VPRQAKTGPAMNTTATSRRTRRCRRRNERVLMSPPHGRNHRRRIGQPGRHENFATPRATRQSRRLWGARPALMVPRRAPLPARMSVGVSAPLRVQPVQPDRRTLVLGGSPCPCRDPVMLARQHCAVDRGDPSCRELEKEPSRLFDGAGAHCS